MGYPESNRKQLFYKWVANELPLITYRLYVSIKGQWFDTYIRANWPTLLNPDQEKSLREFLLWKFNTDFGGYELVQA